MSKTDVAVKEEPKSLAMVAGAVVPDFMQQDMEDYAGVGIPDKPEDNVLPFLGIIQKSSPQLTKQDPKYIKGAEVGMILNSATGEMFSGEDGVTVIAVGYQKNYVEWVPRDEGGGYVATHPFSVDVLRQMKAIKGERGPMLSNGHQMVETMYTFVIIDGSPAVIGATSTQLGPMRQWSTLRGNFKNQKTGRALPSWARMYRLTTVYQKNDKGDWYNWKVADAGFVMDSGQYEIAKEFGLLVAEGKVSVGRPDDADWSATPAAAGAPSHIEDDGIPV